MSNRQLSLGLGFVGVTFPLTLANFRHAGQRLNDIVLCMIVFVFAGASCKTRFAPERNPPPKPQGEEALAVNAMLHECTR